VGSNRQVSPAQLKRLVGVGQPNLAEIHAKHLDFLGLAVITFTGTAGRCSCAASAGNSCDNLTQHIIIIISVSSSQQPAQQH
jgi:hypothetical protein